MKMEAVVYRAIVDGGVLGEEGMMLMVLLALSSRYYGGRQCDCAVDIAVV